MTFLSNIFGAQQKDPYIMPRFRKKPVIIEAMQFTDDDKQRVFNFVTCNCAPDWDENNNPTLRIQTLEGETTAVLGDWVIKGSAGEFYPCKPDIFAAVYEPVTEYVARMKI